MNSHVRNFDSINKLVDLLTDADGVVKLSINLADKEGKDFSIPLSEINEVYNWLSAVEPKPILTPIEFYRGASKAFLGILPFFDSKSAIESMSIKVTEAEISFAIVVGQTQRQFHRPNPRRGELIYVAHMLGRLHDSLKLLVWSWDNEYTVDFDGTTYHVTDLTAVATNAAAEEQVKEKTDAAS